MFHFLWIGSGVSEMREEQVVVIGAGPCGMSAAIELMNEGYDPLIIEKRKYRECYLSLSNASNIF